MKKVTSKEIAARSFEREGWRLKLPEKPIVLDDAKLLEYRHPTEYFRLTLALAATAVFLSAVMYIGERDLLIVIALLYGSMLLTSIQAKTYYRLQSAEVTPTQFRAIYEIVEELRQRFHAPPTRVFILRKQIYEVEAFGLMSPYVIVLPSVVIDSLELDELRYVLGQALGRICFGHTRVALLLGGEGAALPSPLSWAAWLRDLLFGQYKRAALTSGDRVGVLACGGVAKAIRTQIKLSIGTNQLDDLRAEDLIEQAYKLHRPLSRLQTMLIRWEGLTLPLIPRLQAMIEWAGRPSDI